MVCLCWPVRAIATWRLTMSSTISEVHFTRRASIHPSISTPTAYSSRTGLSRSSSSPIGASPLYKRERPYPQLLRFQCRPNHYTFHVGSGEESRGRWKLRKRSYKRCRGLAGVESAYTLRYDSLHGLPNVADNQECLSLNPSSNLRPTCSSHTF